MSNLRFSLRHTLARESDTSIDGIAVDPVELDQVDSVLAEPISADIASDVVAEADRMGEESGALLDAAADADEMADLSETLVESTEDGGDGVDEAGVKMAVAALERCRRAYAVTSGMTIARESLSTRSGRREVTLTLAREADANQKGLWERVVQGAKDLWEWIKNFVAGLFDKRKRLLTKAEALRVKAEALKKANATVKADAKIEIAGNAAMAAGKVQTDPVALLAATGAMVEQLDWVADLASGSFGLDATNSQVSEKEKKAAETTDMNPGKLGNVVFTIKFDANRAEITKTPGDAPSAVSIAPLGLDAVIAATAAAKKSINQLQEAEKALKKAEQQVGGTFGKLKALATGKDATVSNVNGNDTKSEVAAGRAAVLSRLRAVSTISGTVAGTVLSAIDSALTTGQKSLAAYEVAAKK